MRARNGGGLRLQPREIDPHAVVARTIDDLRVSFPGRRLEHATVGAGTCVADPDRLAQLLGNLVGNAMTLGDPTGVVTLTSTINDRSLTMSVHSDGPPVPPEQLPTFFDATARGSSNGPSPAAGLGFFIVREIARAHGGSVTAQSSPDDGTTIAVVLPVAVTAG